MKGEKSNKCSPEATWSQELASSCHTAADSPVSCFVRVIDCLAPGSSTSLAPTTCSIFLRRILNLGSSILIQDLDIDSWTPGSKIRKSEYQIKCKRLPCPRLLNLTCTKHMLNFPSEDMFSDQVGWGGAWEAGKEDESRGARGVEKQGSRYLGGAGEEQGVVGRGDGSTGGD